MATLSCKWTKAIASWNSSGLSIAAWCRHNGLNYNQFLYWRKRLGTQRLDSAGRFVELKVKPSSLCLECNGMTIHIEHGFDPALLSDVLTIMKQV